MTMFIFLFLYLTAIPRADAACSTPAGVAGQFYYNSSTSLYNYCNNTNWIPFEKDNSAGSQGACSVTGELTGSASGALYCDGSDRYKVYTGTVFGSTCSTQGLFEYNTTLSQLNFCDGSKWIEILRPDTWKTIPDAPDGHSLGASAWTGSQALFWGGDGVSAAVNTGHIYNPLTNSWSSISTTGAPSARVDPAYAWSGTELLVWGGANAAGTASLQDGAKYNPSTDSWTTIQTSGRPSSREAAGFAWSDSELLVWGGYDYGSSTVRGDGGRYNPTTNSWSSMNNSGAPSDRYGPGVAWSGSELIVWGGTDDVTDFANGARYNPSTNTWTSMSNTGAPSGRFYPTTLWTGSHFFVWGGEYWSSGYKRLQTGGLYDPSSNSWSTVSTTGTPSKRVGAKAIWTGDRILVYGGESGNTQYNDGALYDPATNTWSSISLSGAPVKRTGHALLWTGFKAIAFSGHYRSPDTLLISGGIYTPPQP